MIFLDESGKRWRRIKRSTAVMAILASLPVVALLSGSLAYQPGWGVLPHFKHIFGTSSSPSTIVRVPSGLTVNEPSSPNKTTPKPTTSTQPTGQLAYQPNGLSPNPSAASTTTPPNSTTAATSTTTTPAQSTTPNSPVIDPGNSTYGRDHQPSHPL